MIKHAQGGNNFRPYEDMTGMTKPPRKGPPTIEEKLYEESKNRGCPDKKHQQRCPAGSAAHYKERS
jgi:hypothetical protein